MGEDGYKKPLYCVGFSKRKHAFINDSAFTINIGSTASCFYGMLNTRETTKELLMGRGDKIECTIRSDEYVFIYKNKALNGI